MQSESSLRLASFRTSCEIAPSAPSVLLLRERVLLQKLKRTRFCDVAKNDPELLFQFPSSGSILGPRYEGNGLIQLLWCVCALYSHCNAWYFSQDEALAYQARERERERLTDHWQDMLILWEASL